MLHNELLLTFRQAVASNDVEALGIIGTLTYIDDLDELAQSADETISGHAIEIRNILHSANSEHSFIGDELTDFCYTLYVKLVKDWFTPPASTVTTLVHLNIESKQPLTAQHIEHIKDAVAYILNERAEVVSVDCPLYEEI